MSFRETVFAGQTPLLGLRDRSMSRSRFLLLSLTAFCLTMSIGCSTWFGKSRVFAKGEQWEPEIEESKADWRSDAGKIGRGNRRTEKQDPLDNMLWSDQARDINRNMGFN